ncbi:MAG TPA: LCP family protein [Anaerolineales bacterium]
MNTAEKLLLGLLGITACVAVGVAVLMAGQTYQVWAAKPLGPALQIPTAGWSLPPTWTPSPAPLPGTPAPARALLAEATSEVFAVNPATPAFGPRCGGPPVMHLLAVGSDQRGDNYVYGLGDVIRLVRVDFTTPKVTVLEFPRDLWVEIPDISDNLHGQDHEKLNQAYLYGNRGFGYTNDPAQGPGLMARTLALNFGVKLDHYVGVNMRTFVKMVNAVDGIDLYLPNGLDGRTSSDRSKRLVFPGGWNHLDGDQALTVARIRNEGVFSRADHQDMVLCAFRSKLTRPEVVTQIPQLIASFQGSIQTDLSPDQISQLACLGPQIRPENIQFASFPEEYFKGTRIYDPVFKGRVFIWEVDFDILRGYVASFQAGTWPPPGIPGPSTGESPILCQ